MYQSTAAFAAAIQQSHTVVTHIEIWGPNAGAPMLTLDAVNDQPTTVTPSLVLIDGSVSMDKANDQRSTCSLTFNSPDGSMVPMSNTAPLTPWGNEIRIWRGVQYTNGSTELIPLGCFRINKVDIKDEAGGVTMTVTGADRSKNIARNVVPFYWPELATQNLILNKSWANMIQVALQERWSPIQFNATIAQWTALQNDPINGAIPNAPPTFSEGTDMWNQMRQYAKAAGCDLFFNRLGICVMARDPNFNNHSAQNNAASLAVATFAEGATATFEKVNRTLDDAAAYNYVIVFGEGDLLGTPLFNYFPNGTPVADNDPKSPTYAGVAVFVGNDSKNVPLYDYKGTGSTYGLVPHIVTNNLLTSMTQVNNFAQLQLLVDIGAQEAVTIPSMVCDPRLDVDDVIIVQRARIGLAASVGYVIQQVQIPLLAKSNMQLSVKEKRNLTL